MTAHGRISVDDRAQDLETARKLFDGIAALSADTEGVSRPAFSGIESETLRFLENFARSQGLEVWYDAGLNARFCLPGDRGAARYTVVGSHVDSVPQGGNFDGLAGVVAEVLNVWEWRVGAEAIDSGGEVRSLLRLLAWFTWPPWPGCW